MPNVIFNCETYIDQDKRLLVDGHTTAWEVYRRDKQGAMYSWVDMYGTRHLSSNYRNLVRSSVRVYNEYHKKFTKQPDIRLG